MAFFSLDTFIDPSQVTGLDLFIEPNGDIIFNSITLKRKGTVLSIVNRKQDIKSIEQLKENIDPKTPVVITINGKGVLFKKIDFSESDTSGSLLTKILPNAKQEDFYLFKFPINEDQAYFSVIRKNALDAIISDIRAAGFSIINIFPGPCILSKLVPLIKNSEKTFSTQYFKITANSDGAAEFEPSNVAEHEITIGNDTVSSYLLLAFAGAFSELLDGSQNSDAEPAGSLKKEYKSKKIFYLSLTSVLIFYFVVIWGNMLLFNHFTKKKNELSAKTAVSKETVEKLDKLKTELFEKTAFVNKTGLLQNSKTSFYADNIARIVPASVLLKEIYFNPIVKNPNDDKDLSFQVNKIWIKGDCKKNIELNEWIRSIKGFDWVDEVNLNSFLQDKERNTGDFFLEVKIR